jgi:hypothetical protein
MKNLKKLLIASGLVLSGITTGAAYASNMSSIALISDSTTQDIIWVGHGGGAYAVKITNYEFNWRLTGIGPNHICSVRVTDDNWKNYTSFPAQFVRYSGATEEWRASGKFESHGGIKYVFSCTDQDIQIRETQTDGTTRNSFGLTLNSPVMIP